MALRHLVLPLLLVSTSCSSDGGSGVTLAWSFGEQALGCDAAGVQTVHVFVGPLEPTGSYDQEVECVAGETGLQLHGVAPGQHILFLKGLAKDQILFELQQEVTVGSGDLGRFVMHPYSPPL